MLCHRLRHSYLGTLVCFATLLASVDSFAKTQKEGSFGVSYGRNTAEATNQQGQKGSYSQIKVFLNEILDSSAKMELSFNRITGPDFPGQDLTTTITAFDYISQQSGTGFYGRIGLGLTRHSESIGSRTAVSKNQITPRLGVGFEWSNNVPYGIRFDAGTDFRIGDSKVQSWSGSLTHLSLGVFYNF